MIGTTDDALLDEQAERIAALKAEIERLRADNVDKARAWDAIALKNAEIARLRAALKRILATPRDDWQFRDGHVVGEVHLIAAAALEQGGDTNG